MHNLHFQSIRSTLRSQKKVFFYDSLVIFSRKAKTLKSYKFSFVSSIRQSVTEVTLFSIFTVLLTWHFNLILKLLYSLSLTLRVTSVIVVLLIISRPGGSPGRLYKHLRDWLIKSVSQSVSLFHPQLYGAATPKRLEIALLVIK